jgi:translation initiation factor IF-3
LPRVNEEIKSDNVRLVDQDGEMVGVVSMQEAVEAAARMSLDLVEISPDAEPPVCKLLDFGRYKFEQKRKQNDGKKKQKIVQVKEIKLRPTIDVHDYNVKLRHIEKFIGQGNKVKVSLRFRGREITHTDVGMAVMKRILADTEEIAKIEVSPKMDGRQIIMVIMPK